MRTIAGLVVGAGMLAIPLASSGQVAATPGALVWVLKKTVVNPTKDPVPRPDWSISTTSGHMDWKVLTAPQADFDVDYKPPPARLTSGKKHTIKVTVAGRITGGTDTQGFRNVDAILLVNDRWDRQAVGVSVNCYDPIGTEPISCTPPARRTGPLVVSVPAAYKAGEKFSVGLGALNCGNACYVRYEYTAQGGSTAKPPPPKPKPAMGQLGIDYKLPERFGEEDADGVIRYPTVKEMAPDQWVVYLDVRRKDGKPCERDDLIAVTANGVVLTPAKLERISRCRVQATLPREGKYRIVVRMKTDKGVLRGQRDIVVQDWLIVGLGDSNGSGEGTPDIASSNPGRVRWQSQRCDRSANSHQAQAALRLEQRDPRTSVTFIHLACSGASILDGLLGPYEGIVALKPPLPPQVDAMENLAQGREIDAVIISVGINDLGFAQLVVQCLTRPDCPNSKFPQRTSSTTMAQVMQERMDSLPLLYKLLAEALEQRDVAASRVYVTQYFDSTHGDDGKTFCNPLIDTPGSLDFDQSEAKYAYQRILVPLNAHVAAAAKK
ncbi:MAG TPA: hypothetical protein VFR32_10950, partial [Gaiellaceae bacterium]|nr:hypothetical protein [Gaiellaceae bacterium]